MKLFGHPESGHAFKVKLCLELAGIEHDYENVDIFLPREKRPTEFRDNSKFHEVPMLLDEGEALVQSNAILQHIASKFRVMGGEDEILFRRCKEWLFWEANKIGMCIPQLRVARKFEDDSISAQTQVWLEARYAYDSGILEQELNDGRAFILGDTPTIADCSLCGYLVFADEAKVVVPPNVAAWLSRLSSLEGWQHPYQLLK